MPTFFEKLEVDSMLWPSPEDDRMLSPPGLQQFTSSVESMRPESISPTTLHADRAGDALAYPSRDPRLVMSAGHAHDYAAH